MTKTDLEIWAKDVFWSAYTGLTKTPVVTKYGAGGRGEAIKKIMTMNPSKDMRDRLIAAIAAQMAHRRTLFNKCGSMQSYVAKVEKSSDMKFYSNRHATTWLNQMGYEDEIPQLSELKPRHQVRDGEVKCRTTDCNYPSHGLRLGLCGECITKQFDPYRQEKRDYLRSIELTMNEGETMHSYAMRCQAEYRRLMK